MRSARIRRSGVAVAFGRTLRSARRTAQLSQEELGYQAHIDRTYPSLLERGLRTPTLTTVLDVAAACGVPAEDLFRAFLKELRGS